MDYIRFAISNPVKVTVGVILLLLFGALSVVTIPVQLVPNVDRPIITVETNWTGRSPEEVEREIIEEQEDKLKSVSNLKKMTATASQGQGEIELEFYLGTNVDRALQEVSDKLREVPDYPDDVDEPVINASEGSSNNAIAWIILDSTDPEYDLQGFYDVTDKRIKPYLERVHGLSRINIYGGRERQVHIQLNPKRLAERGVTFDDLAQALRRENVNVSAGDLPEGRLDVRVRMVGQYDRLEDIRQTVVAYTDGGPVRVGDLGDVVLTLEKRRSFVRANGKSAIAISATRETGSNVIQVMKGLQQRIEEVNRTLLPQYGHGLHLRQVYDETVYIYDALELVVNNLWIGGSMAVLVLLLFLRTIRPTVIIALAIPISVVGTFVVMTTFGRNLNVVSLAGLAFAVGMVIDNAIVVLENIDRHLGMGQSPAQAAYRATKEVWGAILASTLTTLAVFVPVLTVEEEAGQLFRDIALAICAAVTLSLIVSVTVISCASAHWLRPVKPAKGAILAMKSLFGATRVLDTATRAFAALIHWVSGPGVAKASMRLLVVAIFTIASLGGVWALKPKTSYLPEGNRNLVFGIMFTPPAYNIEHNERIGHRIEKHIKPYWEAQTTQQASALGPVINFETQSPYESMPAIDNYFFVSWGGTVFMGSSSKDKQNVAPLAGLLNQSMASTPGSFGFAKQTSIFGRGVGTDNEIDVELAGTDLDSLRVSAQAVYMQLAGTFGFSKVQPSPMNFSLAGPELQIKIDQVRAKDLGLDVASLGLAVESLVDGAIIGDYRLEGESIDLLLIRHPHDDLLPDTIGKVPLAVRLRDDSTTTVPLSAVVDINATDAPQQISRIEQMRSITFSVRPPNTIPLEEAQEQIDQIIGNLRDSRQIAPEIQLTLAGTADKLTQVRQSLLGKWTGWNIVSLQNLFQSRMFLALLITYLLMAALFESFLYPFVIMFSVPLAAVGGFIGLALMRQSVPSQQLDVLTMLGFVILIGVVVNNAILIVHQALNFMRGTAEGDMQSPASHATHEATPDPSSRQPRHPREAIREAVRTRIRPVFMTTLTSVFGMLPLVLMPGSGSELYKGLGSVVVGGLVVSTVFTLVVVPLVFSLVLEVKSMVYHLAGWSMSELTQGPHLD